MKASFTEIVKDGLGERPLPVPINNFSTLKDQDNQKHKKEGIKQKYRDRAVWYNNIKYESQKQADFAKELDRKEKDKEIKTWFRQIPFELIVNGIYIETLYCDFKVINNDDVIQYYDVKEYREPIYQKLFLVKKALMMAINGINVITV